MKLADTHTGVLAGSATCTHCDGSSALGCGSTTSLITVSASPFCRRNTTSLLMCDCARTLTLFCLETAVSSLMNGAPAASIFLALAGAFFFFLAIFLGGVFVLADSSGIGAGMVTAVGVAIGAAPALGAGSGGGAEFVVVCAIAPVASIAAKITPYF